MGGGVIVLGSDVTTDEELRWADGVDASPIESPADAPDCRLAFVQDGRAHGRCSIWWTGRAPLNGEPTAYVGALTADGPAPLTSLLEASIELAREHGASWTIAPIDGSTWRRYRSVIETDGRMPFPLEPTNPPWWNDALSAAGFEVIERYWSAACRLAGRRWASGPELPPGVRFRRFETARAREELERIFALAVSAFAANPLYAPIDRNRFIEMYLPLLDRMDTRLCLIAEQVDAEAPAGFVFSVPFTGGRPWPDRAIVLKTAAIAEGLRGRGLGAALLVEVMRQAAEAGFEHAIFALMHDRNPSSRIAQRYAVPFRHYALFARRTAP